MDEPLILDRYRLLERLAVGGSAEVWRARDEQLERDVAVKRLHPHLMPDEASRRRLVAEARAAAGLAHPAIVEIYDVDDTGESPALVMELVDGESLATRIAREGPLPPPEAAAIAADIAEALFHAHQRGVIHRDVKPGNVLLSADGRTRLVDFGIAHSLAVASERLTMAGTVIGSLHSMAPEQLVGGPITPRTDLYGLGAVLHESLTGRPPYAESSPVALAEAQRAGPPPDGRDRPRAGRGDRGLPRIRAGGATAPCRSAGRGTARVDCRRSGARTGPRSDRRARRPVGHDGAPIGGAAGCAQAGLGRWPTAWPGGPIGDLAARRGPRARRGRAGPGGGARTECRGARRSREPRRPRRPFRPRRPRPRPRQRHRRSRSGWQGWSRTSVRPAATRPRPTPRRRCRR